MVFTEKLDFETFGLVVHRLELHFQPSSFELFCNGMIVKLSPIVNASFAGFTSALVENIISCKSEIFLLVTFKRPPTTTPNKCHW